METERFPGGDVWGRRSDFSRGNPVGTRTDALVGTRLEDGAIPWWGSDGTGLAFATWVPPGEPPVRPALAGVLTSERGSSAPTWVPLGNRLSGLW